VAGLEREGLLGADSRSPANEPEGPGMARPGPTEGSRRLLGRVMTHVRGWPSPWLPRTGGRGLARSRPSPRARSEQPADGRDRPPLAAPQPGGRRPTAGLDRASGDRPVGHRGMERANAEVVAVPAFIRGATVLWGQTSRGGPGFQTRTPRSPSAAPVSAHGTARLRCLWSRGRTATRRRGSRARGLPAGEDRRSCRENGSRKTRDRASRW